MSSRLQGKHFIITVHGTEEVVRQTFETFKQNVNTGTADGTIRAASGQLERGKESNKLHAQLYCGFTKVRGKRALNALLGTNAYHVEYAQSAKGSWDYCQKEETRVGESFSTPWVDTDQGKRTDIDQAVENLRDVAGDTRRLDRQHDNVYVRYHAGFEKLAERIANERRARPLKRKRKVIIYWGVPRSGKSFRARNKHSAIPAEYANSFFKFDPWADAVLFDEADKMGIPEVMWLKLLDNYPVEINTKGGWKVFNPKKVILTSNENPVHWLTYSKALHERVDVIKYFDKPYEAESATEVAGNSNSNL